ncbi:MAG: hypothetical protein KAJ19_23840 [Gammaproteobacteria bacterium]|nr:hypothetical protein [Gammaproteobacteria bacterium]
MSDEFNADLHYKVGDIYATGTNMYEITGHKPCLGCYFSQLKNCAGKSIFTHIESKYPYDVCGIREMDDGTLKKIYSKVEMTNVRW